MNLKRFTGRTSREALALVRQAFGKDAVVMSTRPCAEGVEVLAMAPESLQHIEKLSAPRVTADSLRQALRDAPTDSPAAADASVDRDVEQLAMSTLSFQDYVRERMLKRRRSEMSDATTGADDGHLAADAEPVMARTPPGVASMIRPPAAPSVALRERSAGPGRADDEPASSTAATRALLQNARERLDRNDRHERTERSERQVPVERGTQADRMGHAERAERQGDRLAARNAARPATRGTDLPIGLDDDLDGPDRPRRALAQPASRPAALIHPAVHADAPREALDMQMDQQEMLRELRSVRGLIEQRFGALAFMERMQRQPRQALLSHKLLECGFSPALVRKLVDGLPTEGDETDWASGVLQRNLVTGENDSPLEDVGGVYALIGPTGVGKTTSTAKLAAAFAARHGAGNLGLITLDAYRVAAHEQLRAYGRILGVPVHTAHDRASLDDLLDLLSAKRMVLIDTAGMAQRDTRTKELLDMLSHRSVNRLLVVNAASQGETIEDVLGAYRANTCRGVILSKIDEAMKLGPAIDALIRHKIKVLAVANGQRVPEDWHRLSGQALVQRALRSGGSSAWKLDNNDVNLVFTAQPPMGAALPPAAAGLHAAQGL
jgi:flagellar biosynthesis protein FlhF